MDPMISKSIEAHLRQIRRSIKISESDIDNIRIEIANYEKGQDTVLYILLYQKPTKAAFNKYLGYHDNLHKRNDFIKSIFNYFIALTYSQDDLKQDEENDKKLLGDYSIVPENIIVYAIPALTEFDDLLFKQQQLISKSINMDIKVPSLHWEAIEENPDI